MIHRHASAQHRWHIAAVAEEVPDSDLERDLACYPGRFPHPAAVRRRVVTREDVRPPAPCRLKGAVVSGYGLLDPSSSPGRRIAVVV